MLRALIVDDEDLARAALADLLAPRDDVRVVGEADSLAAAELALRRCAPDVVFLDVTLGDGDAFELFRRRAVEAHVVFLTASEAHAVRAFEVNALDYLLKPTQPRHLDRALARVQQRRDPARAEARLDLEDRVSLSEPKRARFCRVADIVFVRAADDYTEVHLADGSTSLVQRRLRSWASCLPDAFARCHRSTLVNLHYLESLSVERGSHWAHLRDAPMPLRVSRRLAPSFRARAFAFAERARGGAETPPGD